MWHLKPFEFVAWLKAGSSYPFPARPKSAFSFNSPNPIYFKMGIISSINLHFAVLNKSSSLHLFIFFSVVRHFPPNFYFLNSQVVVLGLFFFFFFKDQICYISFFPILLSGITLFPYFPSYQWSYQLFLSMLGSHSHMCMCVHIAS